MLNTSGLIDTKITGTCLSEIKVRNEQICMVRLHRCTVFKSHTTWTLMKIQHKGDKSKK